VFFAKIIKRFGAKNLFYYWDKLLHTDIPFVPGYKSTGRAVRESFSGCLGGRGMPACDSNRYGYVIR